MPSIKELINPSLSPDYYTKFLRPNTAFTLDQTRINLSALCGDERNILKTPADGDSTLVLRYKDREGAILSMETQTEALNLVQLQGAKNKISYQFATGLSWVKIFGDQVETIVSHPHHKFKLISMPSLGQIVGLYDSGNDAAIGRYQQLSTILGLRFSHEDYMYLRTLPR